MWHISIFDHLYTYSIVSNATMRVMGKGDAAVGWTGTPMSVLFWRDIFPSPADNVLSTVLLPFRVTSRVGASPKVLTWFRGASLETQ